jgi:hypothetical protein
MGRPLWGRRCNLEIVEKVEDTLRLAIAVGRLRNSGSREHRRRIRIAKQISDLANKVIAYEVRAAISEPAGDSARMSWQEIADTLEISKTAAYTRYGVKNGN